MDVVRVDSGGALIGALLGAGLLDEVSLLVHPRLPGVRTDRLWHGSAPAAIRFDSSRAVHSTTASSGSATGPRDEGAGRLLAERVCGTASSVNGQASARRCSAIIR
ncbi:MULTISPECIES: hypothetical protein [unclassified Rhodococcus (in: high G+C Gram-positive bacteria)]|uniref:hypothetical protein n=1 Tax=unclassified Rhodococcus (in: high G+C Gram-positive bacteria) TaxID=192944 RepID=UPI001E5CFB26|nr:MULTISPECIES: hypothetical protein [unclassified Rhodococcus (in: high G+C Gram-positive bacteria)]